MEYADLHLLAGNSAAGTVRRVSLNGRDYLVAPITGIVPGVLRGSQGALFYPPDEVGRNVSQWDGVPIVAPDHPTHNGVPVSARHPAVAERFGIGTLYKTVFNGRLRHEGWFDVDRTRAADRRFGTDVYDRLTGGRPIEVSTGLYTDNEAAAPGASHQGKPYDYIARNYRPDHLAVLPNKTGACNIQDGCGVLVNREVRTPPAPRPNTNAHPNQPRHAGSGRYLPHNAGTGKGLPHEQALEGFRSVRDYRLEHANDGGDDVGEEMAGLSGEPHRLQGNANPEGINQYTRGASQAAGAARKAADALKAASAGLASPHAAASAHADTASVKAGKLKTAEAHKNANLAHVEAVKSHDKEIDRLRNSSASGARNLIRLHEDSIRAHGEAAGAHQKVVDELKKSTQNSSRGSHRSTGMVKVNEWSAALAPAAGREQAVALLTANCACDEDRVAVANLSDETLQALAANALFTKKNQAADDDGDADEEPDDDEDDGRPGRNGRRCADGMEQNDDATPSYGERSQPDAPGDSDPHLEDDPEEAGGTAGTVADGRAGNRPAPGGSGTTPRRMAPPPPPGRNRHQGDAHVTAEAVRTSNAAPARSRLTREEQEDLAFARNAKLQAKRGLVNRLTANVAHDPARLKHHQTRLMALSLNELRQMAELLPPPDQYQPAAPVANEEGAAYYGGMGMDLAPGTGLTANEAAEVLDIGSARAGYDPWLAQAGK